ncbi:MAG: hypothetical protein JEZ00_02585 [Anaerolineaceae bacterium]|nr:hypothetical protein [Anaerolineaceae bacterium]
MNKKTPTIFDLLFGFVILLAFVLRIVFASQWYLSEKEATIALNITANPTTMYQVWTGFLFRFISESEFFARIIPVLFGTGFVMLPLLLRKRFGDTITLILGVALAFDPGLIAISKQAGPEIMAISAFFSILIFLYARKWTGVGIALAIGLLSGPSFWIGVFSISICLSFSGLLSGMKGVDDDPQTVSHFVRQTLKDVNWKSILSSFGLSLIIGGTLLLAQTKTLAGIANGLIGFFQRENPGFYAIPLSAALIGFVVAYISVLVFGLFGVRRFPSSWRGLIWLWVLITFIFVSLFPNRQLADYIWIVIPLYIPAAKYLGELKIFSSENRYLIAGSAFSLSMLLLFALFSSMRYIKEISEGFADSGVTLYLYTAIAALFVFFMILLIIGWGWSRHLMRDIALFIFVGGVLFLYLVPSMKSAGFDAQPKQFMWFQTGYFEDADLFRKTILQLDQNRQEKNTPLHIQVQNIQSDVLLWELRNYSVSMKNAEYLFDNSDPDVIVTSMDESPQVAQNRMGQDMIFSRTVAWSLMTNQDWRQWAFYQKPIYNNMQGIVWASLFEGSLEINDDVIDEIDPTAN